MRSAVGLVRDAALEPQVKGEAVGGQRAERHQQVHVAGAGPHGLGGGEVKAARAPELHRRGEQPLHPCRHGPLDADQREVRTDQQRQRQCERKQRVTPKSARAVDRCGGATVCRQRRGVAGRGHRRDEIARRGGAGHDLDAGRVGREIDADFRHARYAAQCGFETRDAGGAGHALDGQPDCLRRHGIARRIDRSRKGLRIERVALDRGRLGREVDGHPFHAGHLGERLFDMRDATRAGHALYRQYESLGGRGRGAAGQRNAGVGLIHCSKLYALPQAAIGSARDSLSGVKARAFQRMVSTVRAERSNAIRRRP